VFTDKHTHEFQVLTDGGEDTIFYCGNCDWGVNKELAKDISVCPKCKKTEIRQSRAIEVGNIFPLGTWYAEKMGVYFTDEKGQKQPVWFGSYGIGPTRVMGALVEVSHDERGIIWYPQVAPFAVHLISLPGGESKAQALYKQLTKEGIEVLWDDRAESAGAKFADADLIGIPVRLVISKKTGDKIEFKRRSEKAFELVDIPEVIKRAKSMS
jgi:prolyl-tRNA synthetase